MTIANLRLLSTAPQRRRQSVCRRRWPSFATLPTDCYWGVNAAVPYCGCILIPLLPVGRSVGRSEMITATPQLLEGINGLYVFSLLCYYATLTVAAMKTKPIGDDDDPRFTIIVNSASTAVPIGLPPKMAKFCHTSNRSLLGRQCHCALLRLYFNFSATGRRSAVGRK